MGLFAKIVDCIQPLTIFAKHLMLRVSQGCKYASNKTKANADALSIISQKISTKISAKFLLLLNSTLSLYYYLEMRHY